MFARLFRWNLFLLQPLIDQIFYENLNRKRLVNLDGANKRVNRLLAGDKRVSDVAFVHDIESKLDRVRRPIKRRAIRLRARPGKRPRGILSGRNAPIVIVIYSGLSRPILERKGGFAVTNGKSF